jgi:thiamine-phosphate pyrophosphorylase
MIVISNPTKITNEINIINSLFEEGMELFHIRKPDYSKEEIRFYLSEINSKYFPQLVLHQHHDLAEEFKIERLHFRVKDRQKAPVRFLKPDGCKSVSTSIHSIEDFNSLSNVFDYAFLSPIYPSISKENYVPKNDVFEEIKKRTNQHTKLVALGGITSENIKKAITNGFDDVALLGTLWNQKIVHSF